MRVKKIYKSPSSSSAEDEEDEATYVTEDDEEQSGPTVISKTEWGGPPRPRWSKILQHPIDVVRLTVTKTDICHDLEQCSEIVQSLEQNATGTMNLPEIQWNFLISMEPKIYEGRGWFNEGYRSKQMQHEFGKKNLLEIGFIGDFETYNDVPQIMNVIKSRLIKYGREQGFISHKCVEVQAISDNEKMIW